MRKSMGFFTAGFLLIASSAGELFASRATKAERSLLLRAATGQLSQTSSSGTDSSKNVQAQPVYASISKGLSTNSSSYNNLYNTRFRQSYDPIQTIYEDAVKKEQIKRKALLFPAKTQRISPAGSRIVAGENPYLELLAERETKKKLQEIGKVKAEKQIPEALPKPAVAEKMKPLLPSATTQKETEFLEPELRPFSGVEKMDVTSRLVRLGVEESEAISMVAVFNNRNELRQFMMENLKDASEAEREWVIKGEADFQSMELGREHR